MKLKNLYKVLDTEFTNTLIFYSIKDINTSWNSRYIGFFSKKELTDNVDFNINIKKLYKYSETEYTIDSWMLYVSENDFLKLQENKLRKELKK